MPQKFRVISIREELHKELMMEYQKEIKALEFAPSFSTWLSKLLADQLEIRKRSINQKPRWTDEILIF